MVYLHASKYFSAGFLGFSKFLILVQFLIHKPIL